MWEFKNNMPLFHVFSPIELSLLSLYFSEEDALLKRMNIGRYIAGAGILIAIANTLLFQPIYTINSVFLLFEGFCIIAFSLYAFYRMVSSERDIFYSGHFWFTTIFLIYWASVFAYWGMYPFFLTTLHTYMAPITFVLRLLNIGMYLGIAVIFFLYKKMSITSG